MATVQKPVITDPYKVIPTVEDFEKLLTAKLSYEAKQGTPERDTWNKKHFNETPWGIAYGVSIGKYNKSAASYSRATKKGQVPQPKVDVALRYLIVAVAIDWLELIDQLKRAVKNWGYTSADVQNISTNIWQPNAAAIADMCDKVTVTKLIEQTIEEPKGTLTEAIEKHNSLNSKLFTKEELLKDKVRDKMLEIVDAFLADLKEQDIKIKVDDILFIGSNASYNYTKDSDIDLHIVANTKAVDYPAEVSAAIYSAYRSLFNKSLDISIYDIPLELFVETEDSARVSNGVYSVKKNKWVKKPVQEDIPEYDKEALDALVAKWEEKCKKLIDDIKADKLDDEKKVVKMLEDIYDKLRKKGVAKSEYAIENLAFKELRNKGYLDQLKDYRNELISKRLSLEEELEAQNNFKKQKQDCILKIAGIYQAQFTSSNMFIISNIKERDFIAIYDNLLKLAFVNGLTYVEQSSFDPHTSNYNVMPSKQYKIKGSIK
jgi:predicted nucleotidyltransferase